MIRKKGMICVRKKETAMIDFQTIQKNGTVDYQKLYTAMFNAITDAIGHMEHMNFGQALTLLKEAQIRAEEIYITAGHRSIDN